MKQDISIKTISTYIAIFFFTQNIICQTPINVIQSNTLSQIIINDTTFQKFSGNVIIEYSDLTIKCDTILIDEDKVLMQGWGNTTIFNDTIHCTTDSMNILQFENNIILYKNTIVKTDSMIIYSDEMEYNYKQKILKYFKGGNINMKNQNITSTELIHDLNTEISHFNKNVSFASSEYIIETESMTQKNDIISFIGNTLITHENTNIYCNKGLFQKDISLELSNGLLVELENETIKSENLKRDIKKNANYFTKNIHVTVDQETHIVGEKLTQIDSISQITQDCEIQLLSEEDSIFITGELIEIDEKSDDVKVIDNVIIEGEELEGKCSVMEFILDYKVIHMLSDPVLWFTDVQITGDTIILFRESNQLDSIYIPKNPFIISPHDSLYYYNQIKGKVLEGKFLQNKIDYMKVNGNSKMKYFDNNDDDIIGINNIESGNLKLLFSNNNVKSVLCFDQIESNHIEIDTTKKHELTTTLMMLEGFKLINRVTE